MNSQYHYDFSYSITFDKLQELTFTQQSTLQQQLIQWCEIFANLQILKQKQKDAQVSKSSALLFRLPVFRRLGVLLVQLCILAHSQTPLQERTTKTQKIRQSVYTCLQQLQQIVGKDRSKYINIVILCLYAIVQRVLQQLCRDSEENGTTPFQDQFQIFHIIYWQIKGQLVSKQNMQAMIIKMFNIDQFHKFMYKNKQQLAIKKSKINSSINPNTNTNSNTNLNKNTKPEPLTFRASISRQQQLNNLNSSKQSNNNHLYQSFKQIPKNDMTKRKQNYVTNYNYNQQQKFTIYANNNNNNNIASEKGRINFDTFRKKADNQKPIYNTELAQKISPRPSINKKQDRAPEQINTNTIKNQNLNNIMNINMNSYANTNMNMNSNTNNTYIKNINKPQQFNCYQNNLPSQASLKYKTAQNQPQFQNEHQYQNQNQQKYQQYGSQFRSISKQW